MCLLGRFRRHGNVASVDDPDGAEVGVNVNRLLPSGPGSYETYSNMAFMVGVPVEVERAGA